MLHKRPTPQRVAQTGSTPCTHVPLAMYGDKGPPKGYSGPRYDTNAKKHCQRCSSSEHWTFECPQKTPSSSTASGSAKKSGPKTVKLSRSQMLKYGIKQKPANFVPEPTEREVFDAEMKELRSVLTAEVRSEINAEKASASNHEDHGVAAAKPEPAHPTTTKAEPPADAVSIKKERSEERE